MNDPTDERCPNPARTRASIRHGRRSPLAAAACALAALLAVTAAPRDARAQSPESLGQARYSLGVRSYQAGQYEAAAREFRAALELFNSPNSRLMLARCLRRLGRLAEAYTELDRAARDAVSLGASAPAYRQTRAVAEAEMAEIRPQLGVLVVLVEPAGAHPAVRVGDVAVPEAGLGVEIPRDPGRVHVRAEAPGFEPDARDAEVHAGERVEVRLALRPAATTATPATAAPPVHEEVAGGTSPPVVGGGVALGVAVVSAGLAVTFGLLAQDRYASLQRQCDQGACAGPDAPAAVDGRLDQTLTNVFFWTAAGTAVVGAVLLVAGAASGHGGNGERARAAVSIAPNGLRITF